MTVATRAPGHIGGQSVEIAGPPEPVSAPLDPPPCRFPDANREDARGSKRDETGGDPAGLGEPSRPTDSVRTSQQVGGPVTRFLFLSRDGREKGREPGAWQPSVSPSKVARQNGREADGARAKMVGRGGTGQTPNDGFKSGETTR